MMGGRMMNGTAGMWKGGHSGLGDLFSGPPGSIGELFKRKTTYYLKH